MRQEYYESVIHPARRGLLRTARRTALRLTLLRSTHLGARVTVAVMTAMLAVSVAGAIVPLPTVRFATALPAAVGAGLLAAVLAAFLRPVDAVAASRLLDLRLGLEERTSTALELALAPSLPSRMGARVIGDATDHLSAISLRRAFPWRPTGEMWWMVLLSAILVIWTGLFHGLTIPGTPARTTQQAVRQEGERLERFARSLQSRARAERMPQTRRLAPRIRDLGSRLQRDRVDRAEALARITELAQQVEETRRGVDARLQAEPAPSGNASVPPDLLRREALQRQIRQLQELTSRLNQNPAAAPRDVLERLGAITESGQGNQPARAQLQRARQQLEQGNVAGAGESLAQALRDLEGLESLLLDQEGLKSAQRQLERTRANIASGSAMPENQESADTASEQAQRPTSMGQHPIGPDTSPEAAPPPQGPHGGTTPGVGRGDEKLGTPSARLQTQKSVRRVRGVQSEGEVSASEVVGAGRRGASTVAAVTVTPAIVSQVDRYMERARIPARYRVLVRRYFERLARLR